MLLILQSSIYIHTFFVIKSNILQELHYKGSPGEYLGTCLQKKLSLESQSEIYHHREVIAECVKCQFF